MRVNARLDENWGIVNTGDLAALAKPKDQLYRYARFQHLSPEKPATV